MGERRLLTSDYLSVCSSLRNSPILSSQITEKRKKTQVRLRRLLWQQCRPRVSALEAHLRAPACRRHRGGKKKTVHKLFQSPKLSLFPLGSVFLRALFPNSIFSSPSISGLGAANFGAITWKVNENQHWDLILLPLKKKKNRFLDLGNVSFREFITFFG